MLVHDCFILAPIGFASCAGSETAAAIMAASTKRFMMIPLSPILPHEIGVLDGLLRPLEVQNFALCETARQCFGKPPRINSISFRSGIFVILLGHG